MLEEMIFEIMKCRGETLKEMIAQKRGTCLLDEDSEETCQDGDTKKLSRKDDEVVGKRRQRKKEKDEP